MSEPSRIPILDLAPEIDELWGEFQAAFERVARSGRFILGPETEAFEHEVATYLGTSYAIGVNSGTDALVIALRALGIGPGDEVITTPFSFFATAESISNVGAVPVFADVDVGTYNIDPDAVASAVTERTRAIMPVHLYGRPAALDALMDVAERHGLAVVEDCAQSFGARFGGDGGDGGDLAGRQTGTVGHVGAFSFFPSKNLGAFGDAGLVVTDDERIADLARMLRAHGSRRKYQNEMLGYNSRLDALQAAFLRVKLPHVERWNTARRAVAERYDALLGGVEGIVTPAPDAGHVYHQYTIRIAGGRRDAVADALHSAGIDTMVYYPVPQDMLPVYADGGAARPVSRRLAGEVLSLPISPGLTPQQQDRVVSALVDAVG